jgi:ribonuclease PH
MPCVSAHSPATVDQARPARVDGRALDELRPVTIEVGFLRAADGSALISMGDTRVICTASLVKGVPAWRESSGLGWLTAEYGMLPASTGSRRPRDSKGRQDGRSVEIQRLIGRSLRAVIDLQGLGPRTVYLDCDVLEADGGTRCASITGAYVALHQALDRLVERGDLEGMPLPGSIAAVSCGIVGGQLMLDLCYPEDSSAEVDMNVVMMGDGELVEVQASGEGVSFPRGSLDLLLDLAAKGAGELRRAQLEAIGAAAA